MKKEITIANPIYDVVFKFLMEDPEIAKLILSTIIDEEIESLDFFPQENTISIDNRSLTVYRLDFSAKIRLPDQSYKQVLIEIQKAKYSTDIMRFRRYLGEQYKKTTSVFSEIKKGKKKTITKKRAIPILTVYFLGHKLENYSIPVIKVKRQYTDGISGESLNVKEPFIESLTHDSYVIVIPELSSNKQSELEKMLTIFDQSLIISDGHLIRINESDYPEKFRPIIRRLNMASANYEIKQRMEAEDEIIEELQTLEREIEEKNEALAEKDNALAEKDNALAEKDNALAEQQKVIEELMQKLKQV
jgi:hypothetical protein